MPQKQPAVPPIRPVDPVSATLTRAGLLAVLGVLGASAALAQEKIHFTYLWHMEQPIYWPDQQAGGNDRTERAWESILRRDAGAAHPQNNLREIFGSADRQAAYQWRPRDTVNLLRTRPEAGAQVSYSGGLIENLQSLGGANQLGYTSTFAGPYREARGWSTQTGKPRLDVVLFPFHHPLAPLIDETTLRKSIQLYKQAYAGVWGANPGMSRGFFPPEMAFSTRIIPVLASEGVAWSFVSAEKISRAVSNFPVQFGSGGVNCDPPNRADQINPPQANWFRASISRGCAPAEAVPFAMTPRRAQYVNPSTGAISSIIVVPCSQSLGWEDGYAPLGVNRLDQIQPFNPSDRPMLVTLAHDGDNAWGGGFSYYMEAVPNFVNAASSAGYVGTTVEEYLHDHPVPANDLVHVEDGAWVNADGDFGAPQFLNWLWPPVNQSGQVDIANGWAEDARNWAVITAAQNAVETAEQIARGQGQSVDLADILNPTAGTTPAERAWHFFLSSLNSGYMYYGTSIDMEVKPAVACNEALQHANTVVGNAAADQTPPSIFIPQRYPWNPGGVNFGPLHGYQQRTLGSDFWVWTFVHDVSGVQSVTLKYRLDNDGTNPLASTQNETFAGGGEVGTWQSIPMARRAFPAGNVFNNPDINFFEMPASIADQYHAQITGLTDKLVDYYVEAVDTKGQTKRSPIQHVWVGNAQTQGGGTVVALNPAQPVAGQPVTITYNPSGRVLQGANPVNIHWGINNWNPTFGTGPSMTFNSAQQTWSVTLNIPANATQLDMVFNNGAGTWDNNGGQDWHFAVQGGQPADEWVMDGVRDTASKPVYQGGITLWAGLKGDELYVAMPDAGEGNDHFVYFARTPGAMRAAQWAKAGQIAQWDAFLADENGNDFEGWFDAAAGARAMTGANGGVLEGTINLRAELGIPTGPLPQIVHLAAGVFVTPDGGALLPSFQAGASLDNDGNLEANEWVAVRLCELTSAGCCISDLDGDGISDLVDFFAFLNFFDTSDPGADINNDSQVDLADFFEFLNAFDVGC